MTETSSRTGSITWAKRLIKASDWVILDTSSIGHGKKAVLCQIAILSPKGKALVNTLVRPPKKHKVRDEELRALGIEKGGLLQAPKFASLLPELATILEESKVVSFDAKKHKRLFYQTAEHNACTPLKIKWADCLKTRFEKYSREKVDNAKGNLVFSRGDFPPSAIGGCQASLSLLKEIAAQRMPKSTKESLSPENSKVFSLSLSLLLALIGLFLARYRPGQSLKAIQEIFRFIHDLL